MRHTFQTSQWVAHPIEEVFAFFSDPANLPRLMPGWQKARLEKSRLIAPPPLAGAVPPLSSIQAAGAGSQMTLSFRPVPFSPFRIKWEANIVEFEWNHHFCDEQPKGPFAYWRHCHRVSAETLRMQPGTRIVDDLIYELPFGIFSEPAHALFVRSQIERIFTFRQQQLLAILG